VLPIVLAAALPPFPPVWVALVGAATLAVAETVTFPLNPLTVRFDEPAMLGLQPPAASTIGGVATPATHIATVNSAIHLFIRFVLYGLVGWGFAVSTRSRWNRWGQSVSRDAEPHS